MTDKKEKIGKQVVLSLNKAVEISMKSIKIRLGRSMITASGIVLAIAFLMSIFMSTSINKALLEKGSVEIRTQLQNMAGEDAEYPGGVPMNSINYFGLNIVTAGLIAPEGDDYEEISSKVDGDYKKLVIKDGLLVGMAVIGNIDSTGVLFSLMRDRINVDSFKNELLSDDFGLLSLPRELWQERLGSPPGGANLRTGEYAEVQEDIACE